MSIHQVECAALLRLRASTKLVLMAFADSADKDTRVAFPGLDNVMAWAGLRKSRALEVTNWLVRQGYLARAGGSRPGRRAEYLVFPAGCCAQHGPLNGYAGPDPLNASGGADPNDGSGGSDVNNSDGSGEPEVFESGTADPSTGNGSGPWSNGSDFESERVRPRADPSPPPPSVSPPPPARADRPAPVTAGTDGGGGNEDEDGHPGVARFFGRLGSDWTLSGSQRERLAPLVRAGLDRGWEADALAAHVGVNSAGVRNPYAVLRSRLAELPDPPGRGPSRPGWCGECEQHSRLREDSDGRPARCPTCHPLSVTAPVSA